MSKPEQLRLAADIIEKNLPWEYFNGAVGKWRASTIDPCALIYNGIKIRITPPPPEPVPLTAEDVPPGSAIRHKASRPHVWMLVTTVDPEGVVSVVGGDRGCRRDWQVLKESYLIKRPGQDWTPCHKPA